MKKSRNTPNNLHKAKSNRTMIPPCFIFLLLNVVSCSNNSVRNNIEIVKSNLKYEMRFDLSLYVKAEKEDFFDFFYVIDSLDERFTEERKIRRKLMGGNALEIVSFVLEDDIPFKFRIDLGRNLEQNTVLLNKVEVRSGNKSIIIPGNIAKFFFIENRYMKFSDSGDTIRIIRGSEKRTPFITSSALLNKRMKIEFR